MNPVQRIAVIGTTARSAASERVNLGSATTTVAGGTGTARSGSAVPSRRLVDLLIKRGDSVTPSTCRAPRNCTRPCGTNDVLARHYARAVSLRDDFEGPDLDRSVWIPHYLPQWSSRAESAATYEVAGSELRMSIPLEQGLWCPVEHEGPLRVSGIQSGVFSGEVGSTVGQQPFRDGLRVREAQPTQWGWTPHHGVLEVRARMELSPRSMASVWMVGIEDEPQRSGEICIFEVFGDAIDRSGAAVGMGIHPFRDPALHDDFATPRLPIDVTDFHVYATDWCPGRLDFFIDGDHVRTVEQAPDYPMQMMIGIFDFPARPAAALHAGHVPLFVIDYVREA